MIIGKINTIIELLYREKYNKISPHATSIKNTILCQYLNVDILTAPLPEY